MQRHKPNRGKTDSDNRSKQLNRNNDTYWQARKHDQRPDDWDSRTSRDEQKPSTKRKDK